MTSNWLSKVPIRRKLTLLVQAMVAVALMMASTALLYKQWHFEQTAMLRQLVALADVLGANTSAALVFDDADSASQVLDSLRKQPSVEAAYLFDSEGETFASYVVEGTRHSELTAPPEPGQSEVEHGFAVVANSIESDGEVIGTIYIAANLDLVKEQLVDYATIVAMVMLVCFATTQLVSSRLQRTISGPILELAGTAERISAAEDYSIRVAKTNEDELGVLYDQFNNMLEQVESREQQLEQARDELEARVERRTRQLSDANFELSNEVAERRRAEQELARVHRDFVEAARHAGMAEIASGVLHNVGNVLNSVNVSASTIYSSLKGSKRQQLTKLASLLLEHERELGDFVTNDPRGQQIPKFLQKLAETLNAEDDSLMKEAYSLTSNIEHIKAIISTQQSYATTGGLVEPMNVNELLEDALKLNSAAFDRHQIRVDRDLADLPPVLVDKQRILQIVINLIKNAKEALSEQHECDRVLSVHTRQEGDDLYIEVQDTGVGIEPHNLTRVFSHGFSTKSTGHGFGLHSCANAASEMDGELMVHSDGHLKGATFTLRLPFASVQQANR